MRCGLVNFSIPFKSAITGADIDSIANAEQYFSDCYLMSSVESLAHTENGREILRESIQYDDTNPQLMNCYLYNNGTRERYTVPINSVAAGYEKVYENQSNPIVRSLDISINEYEKKHNEKPFICRIADSVKDFVFEYSLPSYFMERITGIKPTVNIAEMNLNINLLPYKDEVMKLFERMDTDKSHSLVIGTGLKSLDNKRFHVYVLQDVNLAENTVTVKNKRGNEVKVMSIEEALTKFKFIVGYFNSDLKKNKEN